jgi:hypothetical protein
MNAVDGLCRPSFVSVMRRYSDGGDFTDGAESRFDTGTCALNLCGTGIGGGNERY